MPAQNQHHLVALLDAQTDKEVGRLLGKAGDLGKGEGALAAVHVRPLQGLSLIHIYATDYQYMCSEVGQQKIREAIAEYGLTGVVVCSCSPRMHEATFRKTAESAGLNPYMVEIANIREQCSWIHKDKEEATAKAIVLAKAAISKLRNDTPVSYTHLLSYK